MAYPTLYDAENRGAFPMPQAPQAPQGLDFSTYAANTAATAPSMLVPGIGAGIQGAGLILGGIGAYQQAKQADRNYELALENYRTQKALAEGQVGRELEDRERQQMFDFSTYGRGQEQRALGMYGGRG